MGSRKYLMGSVILAIGWLACLARDLMASPLGGVRTYSIELPTHVLRFSLPEDVAQQIRPQQIKSKFNPMDRAYRQDGFCILASKYLQFNAPFWSGPLGGPSIYGGMEFEFCMVQRYSSYNGDITSLQGLDHYVRWWIGNRATGKGFEFGRATLVNKEWVYRWRNTIGGAPAAGELSPSEAQVFSFPIDEDMFLEVRFYIKDYTPESSKKWKERADVIREEIKATIVVEPKDRSKCARPNSGGNPNGISLVVCGWRRQSSIPLCLFSNERYTAYPIYRYVVVA
jgi:hypothetical protein